MIYVILGMHKSGTTLVSQLLHCAGINMGHFDADLSYDSGNKFERESTLRLNTDILACHETYSLDIRRPQALSMTAVQQRRMQAIIKECSSNHSDWGFKDPRTCFTYSMWLSHLPTHKIIAIYRAPEELWERYRRVRPSRRFFDVVTAWKVLRSWYEHNLNLIDILRQTNMAYLVLNYERLMFGDDEMARMQDFVERPLADRRELTLYRHKSNAKTVPLMLATGYAYRKWGQTPSDIVRQLEAFR